jgi:hypothetical protein
MKHVFFILAHKNISQLVRLVNRISNQFDIVIHLDEKYILSEIDSEMISQLPSNVYLTNRRISIDLASFDMIEVLNLFLEVLKVNKYKYKTNYNYVGLISGQCYPIMNVGKIKTDMDKKYPNLIINSVSIKDADRLVSVYSRHRFIKYHNYINKVTKYKIPKMIAKTPLYIAEIIYTLFHKSPKRLSQELGLELHCGYAWWILPLYVVVDLINNVNSSKKLRFLFRHTLAPEEHFFQTLIKSLDYYNHLIYDDDLKLSQTLVFFEHPNKGLSRDGHPFTLTYDDREYLKYSNHYFARKFDDKLDEKILDYIDDELID